jgi:hypothetical protein
MADVDADELEKALSLERFGRYVAWADGDKSRALVLYTINSRLSASLYIPLQVLEIALRNRIHSVLSETEGEFWYDKPAFQKGAVQGKQVAEAKADLVAKGKQPEPGRVVAALTFGYWTAFFGRAYDEEWRRTLYRIAKRSDGKSLGRKQFAGPLSDIRELRNRIAHHEPILMRNLPRQHDTIMELIGWLSPAAAAWCETIDDFHAIYPQGGYVLKN